MVPVAALLAKFVEAVIKFHRSAGTRFAKSARLLNNEYATWYGSVIE